MYEKLTREAAVLAKHSAVAFGWPRISRLGAAARHRYFAFLSVWTLFVFSVVSRFLYVHVTCCWELLGLWFGRSSVINCKT